MTRYLCELAGALTALGHRCTLLTPHAPALAADFDGLRVRGITVETVPALTLPVLRRVARAQPFDLIRLCTGAYPPDTRHTLSLLLAGAARTPLIESLHANPRRRRIKPAQRAFYRLRPKRRYALIAFNDTLAARVRSEIPALAPCLHRLTYGMTLPHPTERDQSVGRAPNPPCRPPRFITVSRLDESHKDLATLLHAFRLLLTIPPADHIPVLTILGDGPDRPHLESLAATLHLFPHVRFEGWVDDPVPRLREHDVFVLSTRGESFGRVNVEAAGVGLPVIATDDATGGCRESVAHGVNGLLVPPGDPAALAQAMQTLAADPDLRRRYADAGPGHAARFDITRHAQETLEIAASLRSAQRP